MANKFDDFLSAIKLSEIIHKKDPDERKSTQLFGYLQL